MKNIENTGTGMFLHHFSELCREIVLVWKKLQALKRVYDAYDIPMEVCADGGNPFVAVKTRKGNILELEKLTGIGKTILNNIENGKVSPTVNELEKICKGMVVTFKELIWSEYNI